MRTVDPKYFLILATLLAPGPVMARLGSAASSVATDASRLTKSSNTLRRATGSYANITPPSEHRFKVYEFTTSDGIKVHEYTSAEQVFAVSWTGPSPPDLVQLLGESYTAFDQQAEKQRYDTRYSIRSPVSVDTGQLKIYSGGRSPIFYGFAYLPALLPAGVSTTDIQ